MDTATEQLLSKFPDIISLAENDQDKDKTASVSDTYQIEANSTTLIRAAEDLLFVTRSLKEAWILGQVKPRENESKENETTNQQETRDKGEKLLEAILDE